MRIATWNVNSLKARLEKVSWWLDARRARRPADAGDQARRRRRPARRLREARLRARAPRRGPLERRGDREPGRHRGRRSPTSASRWRARRRRSRPATTSRSHEARMLSAMCGGVRVVWLYAPNGRVVARRFTSRSSAGSSASPAGSPRRVAPTSRSSSAATSTSRRPTPTSGTRPPATAEPTSRRRSARPSRAS